MASTTREPNMELEETSTTLPAPGGGDEFGLGHGQGHGRVLKTRWIHVENTGLINFLPYAFSVTMGHSERPPNQEQTDITLLFSRNTTTFPHLRC